VERKGKNPTDVGILGSKRHVVSDRRGVPLVVVFSAVNVHNSNVFEELADTIEPIKRAGKGHLRRCAVKLSCCLSASTTYRREVFATC
jgi:hypothetical protein